MKILIIEDEYPAADRLQRLLEELSEPTEVVAVLDSVEASVKWLQYQRAPDLILSDIQLSDGLSFEIFEQVLTSSPIVFTTSYDEYAIQAFRVRSIDYLLKPIKLQGLKRAIDQYQQFRQGFSKNDQLQKMEKLLGSLNHSGKQHKKRFLVKKGEQLLPVTDVDIAYFHTENELVLMYTHQEKKYILDNTLEQLEQLLDPNMFFRINRQFILQMSAIGQIHTYFSNRYKLMIQPRPQEDVIVSKGKAKAFRLWLEG